MALSVPLKPTSIQPKAYYLSQGYHSGHTALDMVGYYRQPVYAVQSGRVFAAEWNGRNWGIGGGYMVLVDHFSLGRQAKSGYAHLASMAVSRGQYVLRGQLVGYADSTGNSTGHHLHLSYGIASRGSPIYYNSYTWENPRRYFRAHTYANGSQGNGDRINAWEGRNTFVVNAGVRIRANRYLSSPIIRTTTKVTSTVFLGYASGSSWNGSTRWYKLWDPVSRKVGWTHSMLGILT